MSADARLAILSRVRQAQVRAYIPEAKPGLPERLAYPALGPEARLDKLVEEFRLLDVEVFVESTGEDVRKRVCAFTAGKAILSWDAACLPYGVGDCLRGEKVYYGGDSKEDQGKAEVGLTGCENALAETGTLAMTSGPGRPRTASLMPMTHVAVIRREDILLGMGEFFRKFREAADRGGMGLPYVVFITGPSRTADIELSLTLGVHGPGRLVAVIGP
ncbi:MAG TPA: lactate utilization protein [Fibrobacteria bacterium]|nr:lactate utilization protein [Fibrobacteria bacterium]